MKTEVKEKKNLVVSRVSWEIIPNQNCLNDSVTCVCYKTLLKNSVQWKPVRYRNQSTDLRFKLVKVFL